VDARSDLEEVAPVAACRIGISRWNSPEMFSTLLGLLTSSIGDSPATVIVSCSAPIFITMSTSKFAPARSRMSVRLNVEKPVSSAVTV
jgi:hypothetical protein